MKTRPYSLYYSLYLALALVLVGIPSGRRPVAAGRSLAIGTATGKQITCPAGGLQATACYDLSISCPAEGIAPIDATLKVIAPPGTAIGTVTFAAGGGDTTFYDTAYTYGGSAIQDVVNAGYTAVEIAFDRTKAGWLTGPGGPLNLACRYATANQWIYKNLHQGGTTAPFCPTGNSGSAGAIAYSLAHYGMGSIFAMVEPTSGPVYSRVDNGCICTQPSKSTPCGGGLLSWCYGMSDAENYVDPAYNNTWCSSAVQSHSTAHQTQFYDDSIDTATASYSYPTTDVHVVFGGQDLTAAVPEGTDWVDLISTKKSIECVADAPHDLPDALDGAQKVASDLINYCKLP
ncbi:MAG TPA: hypothetical protein VG860_05230 [Terriglobia bacterium]|jgi:hypothetical protein|nr:hypothetical protein [Terriglobia bacterium]